MQLVIEWRVVDHKPNCVMSLIGQTSRPPLFEQACDHYLIDRINLIDLLLCGNDGINIELITLRERDHCPPCCLIRTVNFA